MKQRALFSIVLLASLLMVTGSAHADDSTAPAASSSNSTTGTKTETMTKKTKTQKSTKGDKKMADTNPTVVMETSMGTVEMKLNHDKAPISVDNFMKYVDEGFYNGTIFHRIIKTFMIQGGGFTEGMVQKPTHAPIKNEATNGLKNTRGTLAMARTGVVDSATAQFFINVVDNDFLNHTSPDPRGYGYAVFGEVTSGMDVVDKIKDVQTGPNDVPVKAVVIKSIKRKQM